MGFSAVVSAFGGFLLGSTLTEIALTQPKPLARTTAGYSMSILLLTMEVTLWSSPAPPLWHLWHLGGLAGLSRLLDQLRILRHKSRTRPLGGAEHDPSNPDCCW